MGRLWEADVGVRRLVIALLSAVMVVVCPPAQAATSWTPLPAKMIVGHRGASAYMPEHTIASYRLALDLGADAIEPDLVMTKDGVLIARHENRLSKSTDVADHPEFADRLVTKTIGGVAVTDWFSEDFTFAEIQTLRAIERFPVMRAESAAYDETFKIPSFGQIVAFAQQEAAARGRKVWVVPELKSPSYFSSIGLDGPRRLVATLAAAGWNVKSAPVIIQCWQPGALKRLNSMTGLRLARIIDRSKYLGTRSLRSTHRYADSVFVTSQLLIPRDANGVDLPPTTVIARARRLGLTVFAWNIRAENRYLSRDLWIGADPLATGDMVTEARRFYSAGVSGIFTDNPDLAVLAR